MTRRGVKKYRISRGQETSGRLPFRSPHGQAPTRKSAVQATSGQTTAVGSTWRPRLKTAAARTRSVGRSKGSLVAGQLPHCWRITRSQGKKSKATASWATIQDNRAALNSLPCKRGRVRVGVLPTSQRPKARFSARTTVKAK